MASFGAPFFMVIAFYRLPVQFYFMNTNSNHLNAVYAASCPDELALAYQSWAHTYDRETLELGYCLPFAITAWLARYVPSDAGEILDAGCGTGLSAPLLKALGYNPICGLDFSTKMLEAARLRGGYNALVQAELGKSLPFEDGRFAAFISTGVFTAGHAPASSLYELVRVLKPNGFAVFTVRDSIFESGGFAQVIANLEQRGLWLKADESAPFRAFAIAEPEVMVSAYVFQKK
jgi:predicted TPR repeat methyltransferase